jgi:hypothetical protein
MQRRKFLIGAGSLAAGSAAAMGTGAFSNVQADRSKNLAIRSDKYAYLGFVNPDGTYAKYDSNNVIYFDFETGNGNGGSGINETADTRFNELFQIRNQGTNQAYIWLATDDPNSGLYQSFECLAGSDDLDISEPGNYITLNPGNTSWIDFLFHNSEGGALPGDKFEEDFQFKARSTDQDAPSGSGDWTRTNEAGNNDNDLS